MGGLVGGIPVDNDPRNKAVKWMYREVRVRVLSAFREWWNFPMEVAGWKSACSLQAEASGRWWKCQSWWRKIAGSSPSAIKEIKTIFQKSGFSICEEIPEDRKWSFSYLKRIGLINGCQGSCQVVNFRCEAGLSSPCRGHMSFAIFYSSIKIFFPTFFTILWWGKTRGAPGVGPSRGYLSVNKKGNCGLRRWSRISFPVFRSSLAYRQVLMGGVWACVYVCF